MRQIDVVHRGLEKVIACYEVDGVLVDPGPQSCEDTLLEALDGERPRALLLTHIHFDHAGAAGALVRRWPDLDVYVHERGAPHMANPERLVASAARLYGGEDGLRETWGEVVPVPEERMKVLSGGETVLGFEVVYTPGHASHHVSYFRRRRRVRGRHGGRPHPAARPHARPDPAARHRRRGVGALARRDRRTGAGDARAHALRHLGRPAGPARGGARGAALAGRPGRGARQDGFMAALHERVLAEAPEEVEATERAAPLDHLFLGLDRWHRKRG